MNQKTIALREAIEKEALVKKLTTIARFGNASQIELYGEKVSGQEV